ncbi:hypothetical protein LIER_27922 [Lithospermum erythrorhizon]|uniref:DUF4283 domain-containing protein n=1 Tax=Lithospermum erythrorhizon TaxID=34254 RepID=A0AAV3RFT6_LITER
MEDYTRLWVRLIWFVHTCPMRIFKWTPDFRPSKESPLTPIWVHFHGLPLYLFEVEGLFSVANSIGKPLTIDSHNVNRVKLGTASVCVDLDASKPLMKETPRPKPPLVVAWSKPGSGIYKVNIDGSFKNGEAGLGAIIRIEYGQMVYSLGFYMAADSSLEAELMATLEVSRSELSHIWHEQNMAADVIAKHSLKERAQYVWRPGDTPDLIRALIQTEIAGIPYIRG